MSTTLRALRELAEQAKQAHLDAAEYYRAFQVYAAWAANYPEHFVLQCARDRATSAETEAQRQGWRDILAILERPTVEVER